MREDGALPNDEVCERAILKIKGAQVPGAETVLLGNVKLCAALRRLRTIPRDDNVVNGYISVCRRSRKVERQLIQISVLTCSLRGRWLAGPRMAAVERSYSRGLWGAHDRGREGQDGTWPVSPQLTVHSQS